MLERWTRAVLRRRAVVLGCWAAVLVAGMCSAILLPGLLANSFAVPGSESERAGVLLARGFGEQPEGTFLVVFDAPRPTKTLEGELDRRLARAARLVPTGRVGDLREGNGILYGEIASSLDLAEAKRYTDVLRRSLRGEAGPPPYVTGQPAIQHDVDPVLRRDLRRAELIAVPIAIAILVAVLGLSLAVLIPLLFAACTIAGTLGIAYLVAHATATATYVPSLVEILGLALAIDYSLLIVHRFREERALGTATEDAVVRTMQTAGRAIVYSGLAVAVGLAMLLFVPIPFLRSLGIAGLLLALVSIVGVLTLQPALLVALGSRGLRHRPHEQGPPRPGFWDTLSSAILRRPAAYLVAGTAVLLAAAAPFLALRLVPSSVSGLPASPEAMQGFARLADSVAPGAVTPTQVVVDSGSPGGSHETPTRGAIDRLADLLFHDPEVLVVASGSRPPYVDGTGRYARVIVVGRHEYGSDPSRALVDRLRSRHVPAARFPAGVEVDAGGAPPQGVDFLERTYDAFPWIVLAVLLVTYATLLRAFRSLLVPLQAVLLNLLTVAAAYGLLVVAFQSDVGGRVLGLEETAAIEGWVPIFLFATLFGLSMDYEVFIVSRMREAWDEVPDNSRAVARGLARSGRVVTAAGAVMIAAFAGLAAGHVAGLQQLGFGLAVGVFLDVTIVRMLVLPSLVAVLGRWNWWLPASVARVARVEPSPLLP